VAEYSNRSFHTGSCSWRTLPRPKSIKHWPPQRISLTFPQSCNQPGGPTETDLGKLIVDAAIEAGVKHFIYSSFADSMALTNGTVYCRMMMHKAKILEYARSKRSEFSSIVSVDAGWYFEALLVPEYAAAMGGFPLNADEEGYLTLKVPKWGKDNAFIAIAEDYGDIVHGVFLNPEKWDGKRIQGVSEIIDWDGIVQAFEKAVPGKKARFVPLASWDDFETYGSRELEDLKQLFHFAHVAGGRSFSDGATENETAKVLKKEAVTAKEDSGNHEMMTAEKYFRKHFKEVS
jgi:hypothetical protein